MDLAHEVARRLHVPLAWLPVAVIEVPGRPGLAMGALVHDGLAVMDERIIDRPAGAAVVVGVDGSEQALRAVEFAARLAVQRSRPLRIVHAFIWPLLM